MNVSVHVILGLDSVLDALQEVDTASPDAGAAQVTEAQRRPVGDEDIRVLGDEVPLLDTLLSALQVKCPASELRLPRSALKDETINRIFGEFKEFSAHYRDKYFPGLKYF